MYKKYNMETLFWKKLKVNTLNHIMLKLGAFEKKNLQQVVKHNLLLWIFSISKKLYNHTVTQESAPLPSLFQKIISTYFQIRYSKDLLYSTRNSSQHLVKTYKGKESKKEYTDRGICITESLCCTPETAGILWIHCISRKIRKKERKKERKKSTAFTSEP